MKSQKGLTLIELLIIIAILGILAAAIIPKLTKFSEETKPSITIIHEGFPKTTHTPNSYKIENGVLKFTENGIDFTFSDNYTILETRGE